MPAGQPVEPGGLDRRFILGGRSLRNAGADTSVTYQAAAINRATGVIFVGGNNDYVGLMSDGIFGELVQGTLPLSPTNIYVNAVHNKSGGGWLILDGSSNIFRGAEDLVAAWVDITPPAVTSRAGLVEYNGRLFTATAHLTIPARDIEVSNDNGVTWDSNPGITTGLALGLSGIYTNPDQTMILAITAGGALAAFSTALNPISATWTTVPVVTANAAMTHAAISDDGLKFVIGVINGQITTSDDGGATVFSFPDDNNPFTSTGSIGTIVNSIVYVADMGGFILSSNNGGIVAFIPETNMRQIFVGSALGALISHTQECVVSDSVQALWPGTGNNAMCTLRNVGQLGKT